MSARARFRVLIVLVAAYASHAVGQDLRKCVAPDGKVTYTNQGCAASEKSRAVQITDSTVDMRQDMLAASRIRQEQAAEAARLRAQTAVGMDSSGVERTAPAAEGRAVPTTADCKAKMPSKLDPRTQAEFMAACTSGQPMAQRPSRPNPPAAPQAPQTRFCSPSGNGTLFCF